MEFQYVDANGKNVYAGSDIELGKYIAEKLGVELKIEAMDFTAVQAAVTTGSVDMAISGFAKTAERAESMELSDSYNMDDDDSIGQGILIMKDKAAPDYQKKKDGNYSPSSSTSSTAHNSSSILSMLSSTIILWSVLTCKLSCIELIQSTILSAIS